MPILIEQGMEKGPFLPYPNKLRYMWRDLERRAVKYHLPYQKPSVYPPHTLLTARIGFLGQIEGWCAAFTQETFRLHWTEGIIIGTDENIARSLTFAGQDTDHAVKKAQSDENKAGLRRQTERAKSLGIFGSPTFVIGDELFWGAWKTHWNFIYPRANTLLGAGTECRVLARCRHFNRSAKVRSWVCVDLVQNFAVLLSTP